MEAETQATSADARVAYLQQRLDEATRRTVVPHADQLATAAVATTRLHRLVEPHQRLRTLAEDLREAKERRTELAETRKDLIASYAVRRSDVLDSLNDIFSDVIEEMNLPWYAGDARIDRDTYLPIVDGQGVERHGGGTLATLTVDYHFTLLRYLLTNRVGALPTFLVIGSPTKNDGHDTWATRFVQRIYSSFVDFVTAGAGAGIATTPFQALIADNDVRKRLDGDATRSRTEPVAGIVPSRVKTWPLLCSPTPTCTTCPPSPQRPWSTARSSRDAGWST